MAKYLKIKHIESPIIENHNRLNDYKNCNQKNTLIEKTGLLECFKNIGEKN